MSARVLDGKAVSEAMFDEVRRAVEDRVSRGGARPHLAAVLVGDDPASQSYVRAKRRNCESVGIESSDHHLPEDSTTDQVAGLIAQLNADPRVSGILVQQPFPKQVDTGRIVELVDPVKDVDGFHPYNLGRLLMGEPTVVACTPAGILELLDRYGVPLEGRSAVVIGRSNIVGKPVAILLLSRHATVTICHSRTPNLQEVCLGADVLVAAVGRPHLVRPDWVKPGAAVVDVGVNRVEGKIAGDVDPAVAEVAGWLTPNPGGVGPMTRALLIKNTLAAEERRNPS